MSGIVSKPKAPPPPPAPTPMPTPDDEQARAARRRAQGAITQRGGRRSTILTDYGAPMGGMSGSKMGG